MKGRQRKRLRQITEFRSYRLRVRNLRQMRESYRFGVDLFFEYSQKSCYLDLFLVLFLFRGRRRFIIFNVIVFFFRRVKLERSIVFLRYVYIYFRRWLDIFYKVSYFRRFFDFLSFQGFLLFLFCFFIVILFLKDMSWTIMFIFWVFIQLRVRR